MPNSKRQRPHRESSGVRKARKVRNRERNEAQHKANLAYIVSVGGPRFMNRGIDPYAKRPSKVIRTFRRATY